MTDLTPGREARAEALAREVCPCDGTAHNPNVSQECAWALDLSRAALASDTLAAMLAERAAEVRARVEALAAEWESTADEVWESRIREHRSRDVARLRAALDGP